MFPGTRRNQQEKDPEGPTNLFGFCVDDNNDRIVTVKYNIIDKQGFRLYISESHLFVGLYSRDNIYISIGFKCIFICIYIYNDVYSCTFSKMQIKKIILYTFILLLL